MSWSDLHVMVIEDHGFQRRIALRLLAELGVTHVLEGADGLSVRLTVDALVPGGVLVLEAYTSFVQRVEASGARLVFVRPADTHIGWGAIKASVKACLGKPEREAMDIEARHSAPVFRTRDAVEGPKAFLEKRDPVYEGR